MRGPAGATSGSSRTTTAERSCSSSPPGRCACCSPSGKAAVADQLDEAVQGRRRARQGAQAEARHAEPRRGEAGAAALCRCASSPVARRCGWTGRRTAAHCSSTGTRRQADDRQHGCRSTATSAASCRGRCRTTGIREALRAQAVVARSYALATLKPGTLFDLYADTRSQVYGGIPAEAASTNRAIGSTAGQRGLLERARRDDLLPLDLGRKDGLERGGMAGGGARAVSRVRLRSVRRSLEAPPLGAVPLDAGRSVARKLGVGGCATSSSPAGRRDARRR